MRLKGLGASLFTCIALVSIMLAAATIWLFLTNPITVANAVNEGDVSPLVKSIESTLNASVQSLLTGCTARTRVAGRASDLLSSAGVGAGGV